MAVSALSRAGRRQALGVFRTYSQPGACRASATQWTLPEIAWVPKLAVRCWDLDGQPGKTKSSNSPAS